MKKGQVGIQFNWIYILIIGGIILLAGISIVPKLKRTATESYVTDVKTYTDLILKTTQLNVQSENLVELGGARFEFTCGYYTIEESEIGHVEIRDVIFSPDTISGKMLGYSKYFQLPFKSEFFTYITSNQVKYVLKDSPEMAALNTSLPSNIDKTTVRNYREIDNENYDKIRYITFEENPRVSQLGSLKNIDDKDVSLVQITPIDPGFSSFSNGDLFESRFKNEYRIYDFGRVTYYIKQGNNFVPIGDVYYVDEASLIAAIYSEDPTRYKCGMKRAFEKLKKVAETRLDRVEKLSSLQQCPYSNAKVRLNEIIRLTTDIKHTKAHYNELYNYAIVLVKDNKVLVKLSCPPVY
ncbi:hypothetical protein HOF18_03730 [archaeon]|nr:hypothetical protein [archaeon]